MSARCATCNKKTGIVPFECKCGNQYCSKHRYAEDHACTYDYKTNERNALNAKINTDCSTKRLNMNQHNSGGGGNCAY